MDLRIRYVDDEQVDARGVIMAVALCRGNEAEHCCWVDGRICRFLEIDTMPDRHWVCGLRQRLGSWEAVHNDPGYIEHVRPMWDRINPSVDCGDYPPSGETCATCGVIGNG